MTSIVPKLLRVSGISPRFEERDMEEFFSKYGKVISIRPGKTGFAYVEMDSERVCDEVIEALNGTTIDGKKMNVERARKKERSTKFLCYNCSQPGHLARDCKEKPRNPDYVDTRGTKKSDLVHNFRVYDDKFERRRNIPFKERDYDRSYSPDRRMLVDPHYKNRRFEPYYRDYSPPLRDFRDPFIDRLPERRDYGLEYSLFRERPSMDYYDHRRSSAVYDRRSRSPPARGPEYRYMERRSRSPLRGRSSRPLTPTRSPDGYLNKSRRIRSPYERNKSSLPYSNSDRYGVRIRSPLNERDSKPLSSSL